MLRREPRLGCVRGRLTRRNNGNTSWWYAIRKWFLALPNNWLRSWLIRRWFHSHGMSCDVRHTATRKGRCETFHPTERESGAFVVSGKCAKIGSVGKKINFVMHHDDVQCSARFHNWMNLHFKCRLAHTWTLALVNRSLVRSACKNVSRVGRRVGGGLSHGEKASQLGLNKFPSAHKRSRGMFLIPRALIKSNMTAIRQKRGSCFRENSQRAEFLIKRRARCIDSGVTPTLIVPRKVIAKNLGN